MEKEEKHLILKELLNRQLYGVYLKVDWVMFGFGGDCVSKLRGIIIDEVEDSLEDLIETIILKETSIKHPHLQPFMISTTNIEDSKIILYPKDYFIKEIESHGKKIIPIIEFAKLKYGESNILEWKIVKNEFVNLKIKISDSLTDYRQITLSKMIGDRLGLDILNKYMIDYNDLIKNKLAISVLNLKEDNPYR